MLPELLTLTGSIPAGAGEPLSARLRRGNFGVYPRRRGGATAMGLDPGGFEGLSPQARGSMQPCLCQSAGVYPRRRGGAPVTVS